MIRSRRKKARRGRMKGEDIERLRLACFSRDGYCCTDCGRLVFWETGHMAHVGAKRRHGDSLDNVRTKCEECHRKEHVYGNTLEKPVPKKEIRIMKLTGGPEIAGGSPDVFATLKGRSDFIAAYCKEKGWDADNLDMAQVMEIRAQDGWKKPL